MKKRLFIRLPHHVNEPLYWGTWDAQHQGWLDQGELLAVDLVALADTASSHETIVVVPTSRVTQKRVQTPAKKLKQIQQAVPFMLEEQLAAPVDALHFAYGQRSKAGEVEVAWIDRQQLEDWLAWFEQAEIQPTALINELDLLKPVEDADEILLTDELALVVTQTGERWSCQADLLDFFWSQRYPIKDEYTDDTASPNSADPISDDEAITTDSVAAIRVFYTGHPQQSLLKGDHVIAQQVTELDMLQRLAGAYNNKDSVNLLQGEFQVKNQSSIAWQQYRAAMWAGLTTFLLFLGYQGSQLYAANEEIKVLNKQASQAFSRVFGRKPRGTNLLAQTKRLARRNNNAGDSGVFLELLNKMSEQIPSLDKIKPTSLTFDNRKNELRVDILAPDIQTINQFKDTLIKNKLNVDMSSVSENGGSYTSRFTIRNS